MGDCCNQDKHSKLIRLSWGEFGKNEIGIKAQNDELVRQAVNQIATVFSKQYKIAFVDKYNIEISNFSQELINVQFFSQGQSVQFSEAQFPNEFYRKALFATQDLVIVNANLLPAKHNITIIDNPNITFKDDAIFQIGEAERLRKFVEDCILDNKPKMNGLVLMGGKSTRMGQDKSTLNYHGKPQSEYVYELLGEFCEDVYFSCRAEQTLDNQYNKNRIEDRFHNFGPMGGILSAMMSNPEKAWLVVACDLPFIDKETLQFLVNERDTSKIATAFHDPESKFPEPLIAIWEPKSYTALYHFLSLGYSCPRKVLINSDIYLVKAPNQRALTNANEPQDYEQAKKELNILP